MKISGLFNKYAFAFPAVVLSGAGIGHVALDSNFSGLTLIAFGAACGGLTVSDYIKDKKRAKTMESIQTTLTKMDEDIKSCGGQGFYDEDGNIIQPAEDDSDQPHSEP